MNFNPTEDQAIIIQGISKFIKNDLADDISQNDSQVFCFHRYSIAEGNSLWYKALRLACQLFG